jgi:hypothetical protein
LPTKIFKTSSFVLIEQLNEAGLGHGQVVAGPSKAVQSIAIGDAHQDSDDTGLF